MEIIDKNGETEKQPAANTTENAPKCNKWTGHIYFGIILIVLGALWLMSNFNILSYRFYDIVFSWQMLIVALGGYLLAVKNYVGGLIMVAVGVLFMLTDQFHIYIPFSKVVLPVLVIMLGAAVLFGRQRK